MNEIIRFENVSYTYPFQTHKALDDISFAVRAGEAVLCTGTSGCGKSTLVRMLNGLIPHYFHGDMQGRVRICGAGTEMSHIHEISKYVGTLFQEPEQQFFALSVADEMAFALECQGIAPDEIQAKIRSEARRFRLAHLMAASVFDLSEGEKQKVALASILARSPSVLVLDEPSANLDPAATDELAGILADLKQQGMTLFIVDHRLYWLNKLVDRAFVLKNGRIQETGPFSMLEKRAVQDCYGLRQTRVRPAPDALVSAAQADGRGFRIENLTFAYKNRPPVFENAAAFLPKGRIIAVTGANGAGKTTLARLLTGLLRPRSGEIHYSGRPASPKDLLKHGSIVLQNTDHQLHMKTAGQELAAAARHLPKAERRQRAKDLLGFFNLSDFIDRHPQSLSGGQKQRLVIACAIIKDPDILILDEPTSGLDGVNMKIIANAIKRLSENGTCVLLISHDLELISTACTHALALPLGRKSTDSAAPGHAVGF